MRIVVAGAGGFLGRAAAADLRRRGHEVVALTRADADLADAAAVERLELAADVLVNAAARTPRPGADDLAAYLAGNVVAAVALTRRALAGGVRRVVHCSTLAVVARPWPVPLDERAPAYPVGAAAEYAVSKLAGEVLVTTACAATGAACTILRLSALYGPGMAWHGLVPRFIDLAGSGGRLRVDAGGATTVDLLHVDDAARAVAAAVERPVTGIVNVAAGAEASLSAVATFALAAAGRAGDTFDVVATGTPARALVAIDRMRDELGVVPQISLADGLAELAAWRSG